jgi:delta 1-pyrroline-5-carboxylate dehydrogenase
MIIAFYPGAGGNRYLQRLLGNNWTQPHTSYDQINTTQQYQYRYLLDNITHNNSQHILTHCMNSQKIQQTFPGHSVVFINSDLQASLQREWALHGHQRFLVQTQKNSVSKLEHYQAFRAPDWPDIDTEDQIDQLPANIRQEVQIDYAKVINNTIHTVPDILAQLTHNTIDKINSAYEIIQWHRDYYNQYPVDFAGAEQVIDIDADNNEFGALMQTELDRYQSEIFNQVWDTVNEQ